MSLSWENILLIGMILAWTFGGVGAIFLRKRSVLANHFPYFASFIGSCFGLFIAILIFWKNSHFKFQFWSASPHLHFVYSLDILAAFFLFIITIIAAVVSIYTPRYVNQYKEKNLNLLGALFNLFLLMLIGVVMADNGFTFLVMWEMMSLISFFLVIIEHEKRDVLRSGRLYLIMTHLGTGFIFFAFLTLFYYIGSLEFSAFRSLGEMMPDSSKSIVFLLAMIGFGTKAGLVPIHIWLPHAHPVAPSHISTIMSAVMIKTSVYGMIRVVYDFLGVPFVWWGVVVLCVGMITAVYGILYGVVQQDVKRFLAYSSVENMGLIFMGIGASFLFAALDLPMFAGLALLASLYHTLNHAFFKGLLFMGAGAVYKVTHTKNIDQLGGLIRFMPQTAGLFLIGVLAIASFPPFNGFISKWLTFQSLLYFPFVGEGHLWLTLLGALAATTLILVGALVALGFVKLFGVMFLAQPRSSKAKNVKETPLSMRLAMGMLGIGIVCLGIFPSFFLRQLGKVTHVYFPETPLKGSQLFNIQSIAENNVTISPIVVVIVIAVIFMLTLLGLHRWVGKSNYEKTDPWACGVSLTPNMSYSGMSFSHPLLIIFNRLFGDTHKVVFKDNKIRFSLTMRKIFNRFIYNPLVRGIVLISKRVRNIQDGSIHSYLAYIFISLVVLLILVTMD